MAAGNTPTEQQSMSERKKQNRGFAAMPAETQREIARKGGVAAHKRGTAHEFTPEEAREAGRKGGTAVSRDRAHMAEIGRKGGLNSHGGRGKNFRQESASEQPQAPSEG